VTGAAAAIAIVAVQLVALCLIPLGLPGLWLQVLAAAVVWWTRDVALALVLTIVVIATVGEAIETLSGRWGARRFGGSSRAAWGALLGGFAGLFVGTPVPVLGSLVMSFVGTFVGALAGEMWERRRFEADLRVGAGAIAGRVVGIAVKLGAGFMIAVLSLVAFFGAPS
jgi:uncharacterized protein YqgC (DUF456 family)